MDEQKFIISEKQILDAVKYALKSNIQERWEDIDKEEIAKSVVLLDLFTKTYCRYRNDYERFDDLKFRCEECPFNKPNGDCICKEFKNKYAPDYRDFGSMGDF